MNTCWFVTYLQEACGSRPLGAALSNFKWFESPVVVEAAKGGTIPGSQFTLCLQPIARFLRCSVRLHLHTLASCLGLVVEAIAYIPAAFRAEPVIDVAATRTPSHKSSHS